MRQILRHLRVPQKYVSAPIIKLCYISSGGDSKRTAARGVHAAGVRRRVAGGARGGRRARVPRAARRAAHRRPHRTPAAVLHQHRQSAVQCES